MKRRELPLLTITAASLFMVAAAVTGLRAIEIPLGGSQVIGRGVSGTALAFVDIERCFLEHPMRKRLQSEFQAEVEKKRNDIGGIETSIKDSERIIASTVTETAQMRAEIAILRKEPVVGQQIPAPVAETAPPSMSSSSSSLAPGATAPAGVPAAPQKILLPGTTEPIAAPVSAAATASIIEAREKELQAKEGSLDQMRRDLQKKRDDLSSRLKQNKADLVALEEKQSGLVLADLYKVLEDMAKDRNVTVILDKNNVLYGQPAQDLTEEVIQRLSGR